MLAMESTKSSSARDGLVSSANGLQQTCSKKIWRRGGVARIAEQEADLHGIIRSHRIGVSVKFLRSIISCLWRQLFNRFLHSFQYAIHFRPPLALVAAVAWYWSRQVLRRGSPACGAIAEGKTQA